MAARIGRATYRVCKVFSIAVVAVGLVTFVLANLRYDLSWPALLIVEALLLAVAALSWLTGGAIKYLSSSRSGWMSVRRWPAEPR